MKQKLTEVIHAVIIFFNTQLAFYVPFTEDAHENTDFTISFYKHVLNVHSFFLWLVYVKLCHEFL